LPPRALQSVHIDIPVPGPHRTRKNSPKNFTGEKREETFRGATEEDPSPQMDRSKR